MTLFDEFTALRERRGRAAGVPRPRLRRTPRARSATAASRVPHAAVLAEVGLAEKADIVAKDLPYGDRRALEIAVALAQRPRVLCLDEPTSGLGSDGIARLADADRAASRGGSRSSPSSTTWSSCSASPTGSR